MQGSDKLQFRLNASVQAVQAWVCDCVAKVEANQPNGHTLILVYRTCWQTIPAKAKPTLGLESFPIYAVGRQKGLSQRELALRVTFYAANWSSYSSHARLEILYTPRFPLSPNALIQSVQARFPHAQRIKTSALDQLCQERPRTGALPLTCNRWLEEQLAQLEEPEVSYHHLYWIWRNEYFALRGYHPADPRRSFRKAVLGCLQRLQSKRR